MDEYGKDVGRAVSILRDGTPWLSRAFKENEFEESIRDISELTSSITTKQRSMLKMAYLERLNDEAERNKTVRAYFFYVLRNTCSVESLLILKADPRYAAAAIMFDTHMTQVNEGANTFDRVLVRRRALQNSATSSNLRTCLFSNSSSRTGGCTTELLN